MATVQGDPQKRRELYLSVLCWSAIICTSTSVGVALVSNDMADLLLGAQWHDVKPLMPWLALAFGVLGLSNSVYSAFDTIGRPRVSAQLQWTRLAFLSLCIFPVAYLTGDLRWIAITRFLVTVAITPTLFIALARAPRRLCHGLSIDDVAPDDVRIGDGNRCFVDQFGHSFHRSSTSRHRRRGRSGELCRCAQRALAICRPTERTGSRHSAGARKSLAASRCVNMAKGKH